tara:strand:- start:17 stop:502 length:486 start_codon:yes stop_codon:yes gene_type:complete
MNSFHIGMGLIEIESEGFSAVIKKRATTSGTGNVLFVNHSNDEQYSFEESSLKMVNVRCDEYEITLESDGDIYTKEFFGYLASRIVYGIDRLDDENLCMVIGERNIAKVINIISNDMVGFSNHVSEIRIANLKTSMNLNDEQYNQMQRHFEEVIRVSQESA